MEVGFENYIYRHGVRGRTRYSVTTITVKVYKIKHHNKFIYVRERLRKAVITVIPEYMRNGRKYACPGISAYSENYALKLFKELL